MQYSTGFKRTNRDKDGAEYFSRAVMWPLTIHMKIGQMTLHNGFLHDQSWMFLVAFTVCFS